jgi:hypothetical protein
MTPKFNTLFQLIIEGDRQITSPHPNIYELYVTDKGLFKRIYRSKNSVYCRVVYFKDKQGNIMHNLDDVAMHEIDRDGYVTNLYAIDGEVMPKKMWEIRRHLKDQRDVKGVEDVLSL